MVVGEVEPSRVALREVDPGHVEGDYPSGGERVLQAERLRGVT